MDPNLELYKSVLHLGVADRRQRLQHLPRSELSRLHIIVTREKQAQRLEELIAGRDLVQLALTDPSEVTECTPLKYALLGRTTYSYDEDEMVSRITNNIARSSQILVDTIARFDQVTKPFRLDALKLVYCDIYYVDGGNATLQEIFEARLQEEELQTPAEQARELVRYNALKLARRNAKWMIPAMERLSEEEQAQPTHEYMETLQRIWKQASPAPPPWIQKILDTRQQWGFIYYLSREANQKYGSDWESVWARIKDSMAPPAERNMGDATWWSIHCQGEDNRRKVLEPLLTEDWPKFYPNDSLAEDEDFRRHFKQYREENANRLSPGILYNTFITIPIKLLPDLSEDDKFGENHTLNPYWVWAYDADWDPSGEVPTSGREKYQGRVRVAIWSLSAWFYAARWEGISLRDMWLKAQEHPDKVWVCYTKRLEEWEHEPFI